MISLLDITKQSLRLVKFKIFFLGRVIEMLLAYYVQAVEILEQLVESGSETMDVRNKDEVVFRMRAAVASKQFGQEEIICSLVADVSVPVSFSSLYLFLYCF